MFDEQVPSDYSDKAASVVRAEGQVELRTVCFTVRQLRGIVPALPGRETIDFEDQIAQAFEDGAERSMNPRLGPLQSR